MFDISKIKIDIITKQNIPININNHILDYMQNKERKDDRLFVQVFYDDVFGNGSSIFVVLKKLYETTQMLNYFLIVVKDVKRWKVYL